VNANTAETHPDKETDTTAQQQRIVSRMSDEEFNIERILLLLGAYVDEEESQEAAISAEEFWKRYNAGERNFTGVNITRANLSGQWLSDVNLSKVESLLFRLAQPEWRKS
jgi:hypothetical protein